MSDTSAFEQLWFHFDWSRARQSSTLSLGSSPRFLLLWVLHYSALFSSSVTFCCKHPFYSAHLQVVFLATRCSKLFHCIAKVCGYTREPGVGFRRLVGVNRSALSLFFVTPPISNSKQIQHLPKHYIRRPCHIHRTVISSPYLIETLCWPFRKSLSLWYRLLSTLPLRAHHSFTIKKHKSFSLTSPPPFERHNIHFLPSPPPVHLTLLSVPFATPTPASFPLAHISDVYLEDL